MNNPRKQETTDSKNSEGGEIKGRYAGILATLVHDLRTPLSSIRTGIEVLKLSLENPAQATKIIGMLERQTLEIAQLLEELMAGPLSMGETSHGSLLNARPATELPRKVLVVDDSRSSADILTMFFEMEGLDVRSAYLGEDALELALEMKPDIIFLDLGLPDMSGYEVAAKIREFPGGQHCFLVALTGRDEEADRRNIVEAGFDLHVVKPPKPDMLREALKGRQHLLADNSSAV
jgi:CheY-like chemotaxis protein